MARSFPPPIRVDVVYAEPQRAIERSYSMESGATLGEALRLAAADPAFAGIDIGSAAVGVFGRIADVHLVLEDRDRVEIYRPLAADPKIARRARVRQARRRPKS
jgi:putative ubiquitin-RnfH superfamily antitoxin RatB of RatAB toxin-antitoxin module